jgi:hypothetical protein
MNNPAWRSEDGQLLRSLREEAGIDELVFARNNTVSLAQLRELELGGSSSFYNPAIKRSTGVKLLKKLGHELPLPEPILLTDSPAQATSSADPIKHDPSLVTHLSNAQASVPTPLVTARRGLFQQPVFWFLCLLSSFALVAFKPWASKDHPPALLTTAAPANDEAQLLKTSTTPTHAEVLTTATPKADLPHTEAKGSVSAAPASCDWEHRDNSKTHTPTQPIKPGNYVYLEAQADTELCVLDSQNKRTLLQLKAGMAKSVYGSAPFLVYSQDWTNFKLFFQGRRVHEALNGVHHLLLNSHPL